MKLHDLRPAAGAHRARTRVGRGIAAGKGKTAGRGTKGQKARSGASVRPWFEGGQTPLQMRIPKLRGFRNPFKVEYEVVNVGRIAALVAAGRLAGAEGGSTKPKGKTAKVAPITVNQEILRATGLVSTLKRPLKILGGGDVDVALFVVADAVSRSAQAKIEAAGGSVQLLEAPATVLPALGLEPTEAVSSAAGPGPEAAASDAPTDRGGSPIGSASTEPSIAASTAEASETTSPDVGPADDPDPDA
jgi:large subunit ribosomal protein L15